MGTTEAKTQLECSSSPHERGVDVVADLDDVQTQGRSRGPVSTKQPDLLNLVAIATRLAEVREQQDEADETREWAERFFTATRGEMKVDWTLSQTDERYEAIKFLYASR